jgi:hypothetical protein
VYTPGAAPNSSSHGLLGARQVGPGGWEPLFAGARRAQGSLGDKQGAEWAAEWRAVKSEWPPGSRRKD